MIEVEYGGGGHRTRLRDQEINCCVYGVPLSHVYKGEEEGEGRPYLWCALGAGSRIPPFLVELGAIPSSRSRREGKGKEKRRKEGAPPLPLVQFRVGLWGGCSLPLSLSPLKPNQAHILPGEFL